MQISLPDITLGTRDALTASLTLSGNDNIAANNVATGTLLIAQQVYMPNLSQHQVRY